MSTDGSVSLVYPASRLRRPVIRPPKIDERIAARETWRYYGGRQLLDCWNVENIGTHHRQWSSPLPGHLGMQSHECTWLAIEFRSTYPIRTRTCKELGEAQAERGGGEA